ncbi:hypothetical protein [Virgibacillus halodenitrificans]|uniref:hypothetical protein n=1 Tax=Virgibacillus halodenitrificans TaxID=1482 RepID=UPI0020CA02AA|nr:hypothetical protein [Virgibacillus halodenitrificans]
MAFLQIIAGDTMGLYYESTLNVLKKNFMLVIMAIVLLIPTFFLWAGVPFFIIGGLVENLISSQVLVFISISLSGGFLFSLYFLPFLYKIAKQLANITQIGVGNFLLRIHTTFIFICSVVYGITIFVIFQY